MRPFHTEHLLAKCFFYLNLATRHDCCWASPQDLHAQIMCTSFLRDLEAPVCLGSVSSWLSSENRLVGSVFVLVTLQKLQWAPGPVCPQAFAFHFLSAYISVCRVWHFCVCMHISSKWPLWPGHWVCLAFVCLVISATDGADNVPWIMSCFQLQYHIIRLQQERCQPSDEAVCWIYHVYPSVWQLQRYWTFS